MIQWIISAVNSILDMYTERPDRATPATVAQEVSVMKPLSPAAALVLVFAGGCASVDLDAAKGLGALGKEATALSAASAFASAEECQRAADAEAFFHGYAGTQVPERLVQNGQTIQAELAARKLVFTRLAEAYDAFQALAALDVSSGMEDALGGLGDAVNEYAKACGKKAAVSASGESAFSKAGGLAAVQIQKRKVRTCSALIRSRLETLVQLMESARVRTEMAEFKKNLAAERAAAVKLLWERDLLDPTPLIDEMAREAGLKAGKDVLKTLNDPQDPRVKNGLSQVVCTRLDRKLELIEQGYAAHVDTLKELIATHRQLEQGGAFSQASLRQAVAELQRITELLTPKTSSAKAN